MFLNIPWSPKNAVLINSNRRVAVTLYGLALSTGVNTTKPAETLKKFFWYSAHDRYHIPDLELL